MNVINLVSCTYIDKDTPTKDLQLVYLQDCTVQQIVKFSLNFIL